MNEILVPYIRSQTKGQKLEKNCPALIILDVFHGQMTKEVTSLLAVKKAPVCKGAKNMTLQLLDLLAFIFFIRKCLEMCDSFRVWLVHLS